MTVFKKQIQGERLVQDQFSHSINAKQYNISIHQLHISGI